MANSGGPNDCKSDYGDLARKFCLLGATDEDLARLFDVTVDTINDWIATVPAFAAGVRSGRAEADATAADRFFARVIGYSHPAVKIFQSGGKALVVPYTEHYPPDVQAGMFWLRNRWRQNWRDKVEPQQGTSASELLAELDAAAERARNVQR
jgi:hypothetical protein